MSLDNIQLPPVVLQGLYKESLVSINKEKILFENAAPSVFSTLGNNRRHILILVENEETPYLPDEQLKFLLGILVACSLTMDDVAILNITRNKSVNYKSLSNELKSEKLFLFGITPSQIDLPLDFPNYQVQEYNKQIYLTAPQLSHFQDNKVEKSKLWGCLKKIFDL